MIGRVSVITSLTVFLLWLIPSPVCAKETGIFDFIPDEALLSLYLKDKGEDSGFSLLSIVKESFEYSEEDVIGQMYAAADIIEIAGAVFTRSDVHEPDFLVIIKMSDDKPADTAGFFPVLDELLEGKEELDKFRYAGFEIVRCPESLWENSSDLAAYTYLEEGVLALASNAEVLKKVIRVKRGLSSPLSQASGFRGLASEFFDTEDGFLYLNNKERKLTDVLCFWEEEEWKVSLFSAGDVFKRLGVSLDITDNQKFKIKMVWEKSEGKNSLALLKEEARFFEELIKRMVEPVLRPALRSSNATQHESSTTKDEIETVEYIGRIKVQGISYVTVDIRVDGFPLVK